MGEPRVGASSTIMYHETRSHDMRFLRFSPSFYFYCPRSWAFLGERGAQPPDLAGWKREHQGLTPPARQSQT